MQYQVERTHGCRISDDWTFRGLKTVLLQNEIIRVTVLVDKGADIYEPSTSHPTQILCGGRCSVRNVSKWVPTTGSAEGLWHDVYEGGWQTIAPTAGRRITTWSLKTGVIAIGRSWLRIGGV